MSIKSFWDIQDKWENEVGKKTLCPSWENCGGSLIIRMDDRFMYIDEDIWSEVDKIIDDIKELLPNGFEWVLESKATIRYPRGRPRTINGLAAIRIYKSPSDDFQKTNHLAQGLRNDLRDNGPPPGIFLYKIYTCKELSPELKIVLYCACRGHYGKIFHSGDRSCFTREIQQADSFSDYCRLKDDKN